MKNWCQGDRPVGWLLFDQMFDYRLPRLVADLYPNSAHVRHVKLIEASDSDIWEYARDYDYIVTSADKDFVAISGTKGFPPKLIKVDLGNVPTQAVASALRVQYPEILAFRYDDEPIYHLE